MSLRHPALSLLAAVALLAPALSAAAAADLDENYGYAEAPQEVPVAELPQTKVEFGTGWYVRGDLGAAFLPDVSSFVPPNTYAPVLATSNDRRVRFTGALGGGYSFNRYFRADITGEYIQPYQSLSAAAPISCSGGIGGPSDQCSATMQGFVHSYSVLANGYIDLGTWSIITPYVGAGVGVGFGHYSSNVNYQDYSTNIQTPIANNGNFANFAFALMAGASFDVFPHTKLDIGYRYVNLGHTQNAHLDAHEARAGLRYMIDN